ncbi:MAG: VanW family protein [Clostridia bacterium]|nr:VanW family protein [Clostridia bacterium]
MRKILSAGLILAIVLALCPQAMADWGDSWSDGWDSYYPTGSSYTVTGSTNLFYASSAQLTNINVAVSRLSSFDIGYGEHFSFNDWVGPRTAQYGFKNAVNGRGVVTRGGGTGQVATTLYLAVSQLDGITYTEKTTWDDHFAQSYTSSGYDAVIVDYANGRDFSFLNEAGDMHVEMWASRSYLYCTISVSPVFGGSVGGRLIGYSTIVLSGTNTLKNNVRLAANAINGTSLSYYGEFSFNQLVGPRTQANGFGNAVNGRGVIVTGGGVAQVASSIYLAAKDLNSIYFLEKKTYDHRFNQSYVDDREDAIVTDYNNGHDFRFRYVGYGTLMINTYVSADGTRLITEIYEY